MILAPLLMFALIFAMVAALNAGWTATAFVFATLAVLVMGVGTACGGNPWAGRKER